MPTLKKDEDEVRANQEPKEVEAKCSTAESNQEQKSAGIPKGAAKARATINTSRTMADDERKEKERFLMFMRVLMK